MQISETQINLVQKEIERSKNLPDTMKDELLDHFCCTIEENMSNGLNFDDSLTQAFKLILPDGGEAIHEETLYLLSARKVSMMKRSVRINGIIVLLTAPLGIVFKLNHLPASNLILFISALCLIFGFMPAFFINSYKSNVRRYLSAKLKYITGYLSISILVTAGIFKLCNFYGGNALLITGMILLCFGYLPFFYYKSMK